MQKLHLEQKTKQKLSPQQIQSIALLQLSHDEIQDRIAKELEENPVLSQEEEGVDGEKTDEEVRKMYEQAMANRGDGMKQKSSYQSFQDTFIPTKSSCQEDLLHQLACLALNKEGYLIGKHIIGSLDVDGYLRRSLEAIVDDMAFIHYIDTNVKSVEGVLNKVQSFEPTGIGSRDLQECLLLQLKKKSPTKAVLLARQVLKDYFSLFSKRHYEKVMTQLGITDVKMFKDALALITKLMPVPISIDEQASSSVLYPDFIVSSRQGSLQVMLHKEQFPTLKISRDYAHLLLSEHQPKKAEKQEALHFVKKKIMRAQWFIDSINQRQKTLLRTMQAIVDLQKDFFEQGEENLLKPIFLRDVAERIGMDVSTISRVVNKKAVQTDWAVYPLKYFFSEPIATISGKKVSSRVVKKALFSLIKQEDKLNPYSDSVLTQQLGGKGYLVARRTVTKYREQLKIPIARLRKGI